MTDKNLAIAMIVLGVLLALTAIPMIRGYKLPGASEQYNKIKLILNVFTGLISIILGVMVYLMDELKGYIPIIFFAIIVVTFIVDRILKKTIKNK